MKSFVHKVFNLKTGNRSNWPFAFDQHLGTGSREFHERSHTILACMKKIFWGHPGKLETCFRTTNQIWISTSCDINTLFHWINEKPLGFSRLTWESQVIHIVQSRHCNLFFSKSNVKTILFCIKSFLIFHRQNVPWIQNQKWKRKKRFHENFPVLKIFLAVEI